jgi:iron complex transport system substrate-binding protein
MDIVNRYYPQRIVCLTEETTELLYLLGEQERIVGISGFTVRPPRARKEKPKVSAFTSAKIDRILDLEPDLVLGFSDLLGAMVGAADRTVRLINEMQQGLAAIEQSAKALPYRPRILFEEWNEPLISAIGWVSELIGIAGGEDCFAELGRERSAKGRIIADPTEVVRRAPDIIIGSWCGKRFRPEQVREREGWDSVPAVRHGQLHEIKSCYILQPGPAALTDGVRQLQEIIRRWAASQG